MCYVDIIGNSELFNLVYVLCRHNWYYTLAYNLKVHIQLFIQFNVHINVELYSRKNILPNMSMVLYTSLTIVMLYVDIIYYARR